MDLSLQHFEKFTTLLHKAIVLRAKNLFHKKTNLSLQLQVSHSPFEQQIAFVSSDTNFDASLIHTLFDFLIVPVLGELISTLAYLVRLPLITTSGGAGPGGPYVKASAGVIDVNDAGALLTLRKLVSADSKSLQGRAPCCVATLAKLAAAQLT